MKLNANGEIGQHKDVFVGESNKKVTRYHIPIVTNPKVIFSVDYKPYHLQEGELYRVDITMMHSVKNSGETDRIHLVFDVVDG